MKYAVWNNKGGVGKSFVTFITACEYARQHPDRRVVIVDMCPQANVSEVVLGGNGKGAKNLEGLLSAQPRRTIGGYFDERISSPHKITGNETSYILQAHKYNTNLDSNIYLIAGDPSLEIQAEAINQIAGQTLPSDSWANVHKWLKDLLDAISKKYDNATFFIDCNPSFAAYTELAIIAADRIIVPCTADGSSARAISNIGQLIYGINVPAAYASVSFSKRAHNNHLALPTIHSIPLNRSTQYEQKASKAFSAMYDAIKQRASDLMKTNSAIFSSAKNKLFLDLPDAHSVSVVTSHLGLPLHKIKLGKYTIHSKDTQVPKDSLTRYKAAFDQLVGQL
ncbi:ATPase [Caulobacter flavus]|uniref:ATPase n=1 Tax=Caulobacter flavus TaxID=1679497 RepID=A0A2N5CRS7_9CAUL|nr:ParA family protein [Caulobacter flavus]AYV46404.1 ATPase [Caulobacter flavus]PLR12701.1 ATPase [Caulobacter flavus]